jgi:hypothetical protein
MSHAWRTLHFGLVYSWKGKSQILVVRLRAEKTNSGCGVWELCRTSSLSLSYIYIYIYIHIYTYWQHWDLNSGPTPESLHQPFFVLHFLRQDLENYFPRLALNHHPPDLRLLSSWDYRCLATGVRLDFEILKNKRKGSVATGCPAERFS